MRPSAGRNEACASSARSLGAFLFVVFAQISAANLIQTPIHQIWLGDADILVSAGLGQASNWSSSTASASIEFVPHICREKGEQPFQHQPGYLTPHSVPAFKVPSSGAWLWANAATSSVQTISSEISALAACSTLQWDALTVGAVGNAQADENGTYFNSLLVGSHSYGHRQADAMHHRVAAPRSARAQLQLLKARAADTAASGVRQTGFYTAIETAGSRCLLNDGSSPPAATVGDVAVALCISTVYNDCTPTAGLFAINLTDGSLPWAHHPVPAQFVAGMLRVDNSSHCWRSASYGGSHPVHLWGSFVVFALVDMHAAVHVFDVSAGQSAAQLTLNVSAVDASTAGAGASWPQQVPPTLHSSLVPLSRPLEDSSTIGRRVYTYSAEGSFVALDVLPDDAGGVLASKAWSSNVLTPPPGGIPSWAWGQASYGTPNKQVPVWPTPDATDVHVLRVAPGVTLLAVGYTWDLMVQQMSWGTSRSHPGRTAAGDGRFVRNGTAVVVAECCTSPGSCSTVELLRTPCNFGACVVGLLAAGSGPSALASAATPHVLIQPAGGGSSAIPLPDTCTAPQRGQAVPALYPGRPAGAIGPPLVLPLPPQSVQQGPSKSSGDERARYRAVVVSLLDGALHAGDRSTNGRWLPAWKAQADSGCAYVSSTPALVERNFVQQFAPQVGFCQAPSLIAAVQICKSAFKMPHSYGRRAGINQRMQVHFICPAHGTRMWMSTEAHQAFDGAMNAGQAFPGQRLPGWMDLANGTVQWHPMQAVVTTGYRIISNATDGGVPLTLLLSSTNGTVLALNALAGMPTPPPASYPPSQLVLWSSRTALGESNIRYVGAPAVVQWGVNAAAAKLDTNKPDRPVSNGPVLLRPALSDAGPVMVGQEIVTGDYSSFHGSAPNDVAGLHRGAFAFPWRLAAQTGPISSTTIASALLPGESYGTAYYTSSSSLSTVADSTTGSTTQAHSYFKPSTHQQDDLYAATHHEQPRPYIGANDHHEGIVVDYVAYRNVQYRGALLHGPKMVYLFVDAGLMFVGPEYRYFRSDLPREESFATDHATAWNAEELGHSSSSAAEPPAQPTGTNPGRVHAPRSRRLSAGMLPFTQALESCIPRAAPGGLLMRPDLGRIFYTCVYFSAGQVGLQVTAIHMFSGRPAWTVRAAVPLPAARTTEERARRRLGQMQQCAASNASLCVGVQYLPAVTAPQLVAQGSAGEYSRVASAADLRHPAPLRSDHLVKSLRGSAILATTSDGTALQVDATTGSVLWQTRSVPEMSVFAQELYSDTTLHSTYTPVVRAVAEPDSRGLLVASQRAGLVVLTNSSTSGIDVHSKSRSQTEEQKQLQSASTFVIVACSALAALLTAIFLYAICRMRSQRRQESTGLTAGATRRQKVLIEESNAEVASSGGFGSTTFAQAQVRMQGWADTQQMIAAVIHPAFNIYGAANLIFGSTPDEIIRDSGAGAWGASTSSVFVDLDVAAVQGEQDNHEGQSEKQFDLVLALTFAQLGLAVLHFVVHLYFFYVAVSASLRHERRICTTRLGSRYQALSLANGNFSLGMWPLGIFNTLVLLLAFDRSRGAFVALIGSIVSWAGSLIVPAAAKPGAASTTGNGGRTVASPQQSPISTPTAHVQSGRGVGVNSPAGGAASPAADNRAAPRQQDEHRLAENCVPRLGWSQDTHWFVTAVVRGWLGLWFVAVWLLILPLTGLMLQLTTGFNGSQFMYKLLSFGVEVPYWLQLSGDIDFATYIPRHTTLSSASSTLQGLTSSAFGNHCLVLLLSLWPITQFAWTYYVPVCPVWLCTPNCQQRGKVKLLKVAAAASNGLQARQPLLSRKTDSAAEVRAKQEQLRTYGMCIPRSHPLSPCWGCCGASPPMAWWLLLSALHVIPVTLATVALALPVPVDGPMDDEGDFGLVHNSVASSTRALSWIVGSSFGPLKPDDVDIDFYWENMHSLWPDSNSAWFITLLVQYIVLAPFLLLVAVISVDVVLLLACFVYSVAAGTLIVFLLVPLRAFWVYILQPIIDPPEHHEVMSPQRHEDAWCGSVRTARGVPDPFGWWSGAAVSFSWVPLMPQLVYFFTCGRRNELPQCLGMQDSSGSELVGTGRSKSTARGAPEPSAPPLQQVVPAAGAAAGAAGGHTVFSPGSNEARFQGGVVRVALGFKTQGNASVLTQEQAEALRAVGLLQEQHRSLSAADLL